MQYTRDDERDEWSKLASAEHIDAATPNVKHLAISIHIEFLLTFMNTLSSPDKSQLPEDVAEVSPEQVTSRWGNIFQEFLVPAAGDNATFVLHLDMMRHCDGVIGLARAERMAGPQGYQLLLAVTKESLLFSFFKIEQAVMGHSVVSYFITTTVLASFIPI